MAILKAAEAVEWALEIETNGEAFYRATAAQQADPGIKALFEDLAVQEQRHYQTYGRMLGLTSSRDLPDFDHDEYQAYLQAALSSALFGGPDKGLALARQAHNQETALRAALGFEKDTLLFFYDLREMVSEGDRATVSAIISEEKAHVRRLAAML